MESGIKKYLKGDIVIWFIFIALSCISMLAVYSTAGVLAFDGEKDTTITAVILTHIKYLAFGALVVYVLHIIPYQWVRMLNYGLLGVIAFLLLMALETKARSVSGIQPSEFAKVSVILFVADMLARKQQNGSPDDVFKWIMWIVLPFCALIAPLKLSSAVLIAVVTLFLMIIGRVSFKKILIFVGILLLVGVPYLFVGLKFTESELNSNKITSVISRAPTHSSRFWQIFADNDKYYVYTNKDNTADSIRTKYRYKKHSEEISILGHSDMLKEVNRTQAVNALVAIAQAPAVIGLPGNGEQKYYLANSYDDYIFSNIVSEMGVLIGVFVIALYLFLLFRAGVITRRSNQAFPTFVVVGLTLLIVLQALTHVAVSADLFITGETLPLISRGGSAIIATCGCFGLILSISRHLNDNEENIEQEIQQNADNADNADLRE